jgi:hypothetical protein
MARAITPDEGPNDELTENGILTDYPDITRAEMIEYHGEPKHEDENSVVFADSDGHEFDEFTEVFEEQGVTREEFSEVMHQLAKQFEPNDGIDHWGAAWPVVFDKRTFADGEGEDR